MLGMDLSPTSSSAWIASTTPQHGDVNIGVAADLYVEFAHTVAADSLTLEHIFIQDFETGEDIHALRPFNPRNDYNSISRILTLRLATPLLVGHRYTLVITELYDPAGDMQDAAHMVDFTTSEADAALPPIVATDDRLVASDHTIVDAPIVVVGGDIAAGRLVRSTPTGGSYNIAATTDHIEVVFDRRVSAVSGMLTRRPISMYEVPWEVLTLSSTIDENTVSVDIPSDSPSVYVAPGYEYRLQLDTVTFADGGMGTVDLTFCGVLSPMFAAVSNVLFNYPYASSYEVARMIYLSSSEAMALDETIDPLAPKRSASDYTLYATLWRLSTLGSSASTIRLGDLSVQKSQSSSGPWKRLMDQALDRLRGTSPKQFVKGGAIESPFVSRDWKAS